QGSLGETAGVDILPVRELLLGPREMEAARRLLNQGEPREDEPVLALQEDDDEDDAYLSPEGPSAGRQSDLERLAAGIAFPGMEAWLGTLGGPPHPPPGLMRAAGAPSMPDPKSCRARASGSLP